MAQLRLVSGVCPGQKVTHVESVLVVFNNLVQMVPLYRVENESDLLVPGPKLS